MLKRILGLVFIITLFVSTVSAEAQQTLIISEVMPNPAGNDTLLEWIELTNKSSQYIQLNNYQIGDTRLPEITAYPGEIIMLVRNIAGFAAAYPGFHGQAVAFNFSLANAGGDLFLKQQSNGNGIQQFSYPQSQESKSFELLTGNCLEIMMHADSDTAGQVNTNCNEDLPPVQTSENKNVFISSAMPSPADGDEWVELTNMEDYSVNLSGWKLTDASGATFTISDKTITAKGILKLTISPVSLNNNGDTLVLSDSSGSRMDIFSYSQSKKGEAVGIISTATTGATESTEKECPAVTTAIQKQPKVEINLAVPQLYLSGE